MDTKTNNAQNEAGSYKTKMPVDVRIVAYFLYAIGFFQLICSGLLITGVARVVGKTHHVIFGILLLSTELSLAIYILCLGFVHLLCAWELIRCRKLGWWLLLFDNLYYIIDTVFSFKKYGINALISLFIILALITWLCFRRQLYKIGLKQGSTPPFVSKFRNE